MLPKIKRSAFCTLIVAFTSIISGVSSQFCDFSYTNCSWNYGQWQTTPDAYPDVHLYPNFNSTRQDNSHYMFLQHESGTAISESTFHVSAETVISFDYFFDAPTPSKADGDYFQVYFSSTDQPFTVLLANVTTMNGSWRHFETMCDESNAYCCGGPSQVPCQGTLQITAVIDDAKSQALFAIYNIGTIETEMTTTLTTPLPTLSSTCCQFEDNVCSQNLTDWYWSATSLPPYYIPPNSGQYLWTDIIGSKVATPMQYNVTPYTQFSMSYYVSSNDVVLYAYFQPYNGSELQMIAAGYTNNVWLTFQLQCGSCCGGSTCDGQFYVQAVGTPGSFVMAIDNTDRDSACDTSCCYFDDAYMCGYSSEVEEGYQWHFYNTTPSDQLPSYPGSPYVYFVTVSYLETALNVRLRSSQISIVDSTVFRGNFYVRIADVATTASALFINFYNAATGTVTQLDYLKDTSGGWEIVEFNCDSIHGSCCHGMTSCYGFIEMVAVVQAYGDSATYAVDAFEISGSCGAFPGQLQKLSFTPVKSSHPVTLTGFNN